MVSTPTTPGPYSEDQNRRLHPRRKFERLVSAEFGPENGGILLDLSEGGAAFQTVATLGKGQPVRFHFKLPGAKTRIEVTAQVVWSNDSGKSGGLRFVNLNAPARQEVQTWTAGNISSTAEPATQTRTTQTTTPPSGGAAASAPQEIPARVAARSSAAARTAPFSQGSVFNPDTPGATKSQSVPFAIGVACGCVIFAAAVIAGIRVYKSVTLPAVTQTPMSSSAGSQATSSAGRDFAVEAIDLDNHHWILSNDAADTTPAAGQAPVPQTPRQSEPSSNISPGGNTRHPEILAPANGPAHANTTLLAPHQPLPQAELREPPIGASMAPGLASVDPLAIASSAPEAPSPAQPQPEKIAPGLNLQEAVLIRDAAPVYPRRVAKGHGVLQVSITIGADGVPRDLTLVSGDPSRGPAALEAISRWRYIPAVLDGRPVESHIVVSITF